MVPQCRVITERNRMPADFLVKRVDARRRVKLHREDETVAEHDFVLDQNRYDGAGDGEVKTQSVQAHVQREISQIPLKRAKEKIRKGCRLGPD